MHVFDLVSICEQHGPVATCQRGVAAPNTCYTACEYKLPLLHQHTKHVVISTMVTATRTRHSAVHSMIGCRLLTLDFPLLQDGNFLDQQTQHVMVQLVTYNNDLRVWGYFRIDFNWGIDGSIRSKAQFYGLPAMVYNFDTSHSRLQLIRDGILLPLAILVFIWIKAGEWTRRGERLSRKDGASITGSGVPRSSCGCIIWTKGGSNNVRWLLLQSC